MLFTQHIANDLLGYEVGAAGARSALLAALEAATNAITRLDTLAFRSPVWPIFERHETLAGAAASARMAGADVDLASAYARHVLGAASSDHRVDRFLGRGDADDRRARRAAWRALAAPLTGNGPRLLAALGAVGQAAAGARTRSVDELGSAGEVYFDLGEVAFLTPHVLRRAGLTKLTLSSVVGQPRALVGARPPIERARRWADAIASQANAAAGRLEALEAFVAMVEDKLVALRRPQAVRRAVDLALRDGATWAARLARQAGLDIANAWRALGRAEAMGLLLPVPGNGRYRGDAHVLVPPPVIRALGWGAAPMRINAGVRAPALAPVSQLAERLEDVDAAAAALDDLLKRTNETVRSGEAHRYRATGNHDNE